jgi:hypothetical protein
VEVEVGHVDHGVPHRDVPGLGVEAKLVARHHVPGDRLVARRGEPAIAAGQPSLIVVEPGRRVLFTVVSGERDMRGWLLDISRCLHVWNLFNHLSCTIAEVSHPKLAVSRRS